MKNYKRYVLFKSFLVKNEPIFHPKINVFFSNMAFKHFLSTVLFSHENKKPTIIINHSNKPHIIVYNNISYEQVCDFINLF